MNLNRLKNVRWFVFQRLIETAPWGDDQETLQQQLVKHQKFHSSIQRSDEVDRAKDELVRPPASHLQAAVSTEVSAVVEHVKHVGFVMDYTTSLLLQTHVHSPH